VRDRPGTPRAIAATLEELMLADLAAEALLEIDPALSQLASRVTNTLAARRLVPHATLLVRASTALREGMAGPTDVVFLDVTLGSTLEAELARAIVKSARTATITLAHGDARTRARWTEGLDLAEELDEGGTRVARALFAEATTAAGERHAVHVCSAPRRPRSVSSSRA
jgi:hypothetical protein